MVSLGVDVSNIEPHVKYEPVPPGAYKVRLVDAVEKSDRGGEYIDMQFEVLEPNQYASRRVWEKLRLASPSDKARARAQRRLAALVRACGLVTASETDQLLMKPLMVKIKVVKDEGYDPKNEIDSFIFDQQPAAPAATAKPAAAANAPVWART